MSTSTVVLVHGAFADAGSRRTTIPLIDGVDVIAAPNPLRGIAADTAYLDGLLDSFEGELVLVGHSYGGAVISGVTRNAARVRALVFVAAYIPDEGETLTTAGDPERYPDGLLGPDTLLPCPVPGGVDLFIRPDRFPEVFAADVPEADAAVMARSQRPIAAAAFVEPAGPALWRTVPSWALLATDDRAIPVAAQRAMAERANAKVTEVSAAHAVMVSRPAAVAGVITEAVGRSGS